MRAYLCGPMRGIEAFNFPAFEEATKFLREDLGFTVFSPAEDDKKNGFDPTQMTGWEDLSDVDFDLKAALARDLQFICLEADILICLEGWRHSLGATLETDLARLLDIPVVELQMLREEAENV